MDNQKGNKWFALHHPYLLDSPEEKAHVAKNMGYAEEVGAAKPDNHSYFDQLDHHFKEIAHESLDDEFGITPKMLPFLEIDPIENNEFPPLSDKPYVQEEPAQPQGSFGMNGVQYKYVNGKWTAIKPDGTPMNDAEMYQHTSQMHQKKPGNVTGRPLLPSRLFQKPAVAQR